MKAALCFIISYDHKLNKEEFWKKWIESNQDIINVYFHYKDYDKIKSEWIKEHALPEEYIVKTSYYHVVPAYMSILSYAAITDQDNRWFCMLTDSCVPIISPSKFRRLFFQNYNSSVMRWRKPWWNVTLQKRANLNLLPEDFHLGNDPWFIMKREDVVLFMHFIQNQRKMYDLVCKGGLANESIFAIILQSYKKLNNHLNIKNKITHLADWDRVSSPTSPYIFKDGTEENINWIQTSIEKNQFAMFLRKVSPDFPDDVLIDFINKKDDDLIQNMNYYTWSILGVEFMYFLFIITILFVSQRFY